MYMCMCMYMYIYIYMYICAARRDGFRTVSLYTSLPRHRCAMVSQKAQPFQHFYKRWF